MTKLKDVIKMPELKHVCGDFNGVSYREGYNKATEEIGNINVPWQRLNGQKLREVIDEVIGDRIGYLNDQTGLFAEIEEKILNTFSQPDLNEKDLSDALFDFAWNWVKCSTSNQDLVRELADKKSKIICSNFAQPVLEPLDEKKVFNIVEKQCELALNEKWIDGKAGFNTKMPWAITKAICARFSIPTCTHVKESQTSASEYLCTICGQKYKPVPAIKDEEICLNCGCKKYTHQKCACGYPPSMPAVEIDVSNIERIIDTTATLKNGPYADELNTKEIAQAIADNLKRIVK